MPRHSAHVSRRPAPVRRAATTAGLTAAALVVGVGGYSVVTSPALASAHGDRLPVAELLGSTDADARQTTDELAAARARDDVDEASRAERVPLAPGLPATSAEAQSWVDEVRQVESALDARAAAQEAARVAAEKAEAERLAAEEAERVAAEAEAARVAAEEEAERRAAEEAAREAEEAAEAAQAAEEAEEAAEQEAEEEQAAAAVVAADPGSSRAIAQSLLGSYGWGGDQWSCLDQLWEKESNWRHTADNPSSSAYGIPQALPGRKMASAGADWETNPETQIRWGLGYIEDRYGSPCSAWQHSQSHNWY